MTRRFISAREAMQAADTIGYDLSEAEIVREILRCPRDPARRLLLARAGRRRVLRKLECGLRRAFRHQLRKVYVVVGASRRSVRLSLRRRRRERHGRSKRFTS
jgi:hypothetical protein